MSQIPDSSPALSRYGETISVNFRPDQELSERVIFPITDAQSNGIEDARFVEFNDAGQKTFYATYTAYNGRAIRSELLETKDFQCPVSGTMGGTIPTGSVNIIPPNCC